MYSLKRVRIFLTLVLFIVNINLYAQNLYQTTTDVKLRSGPGVKYKSLGLIKNGEKVNVIEKTNSSWFKIEHNRETGFVSSKLLIPIVEISKIEETPKVENETEKSNSTLFYIIGGIVLVTLIFIVSSKNKSKKANNNKTFNQANDKINIEKKQKDELTQNILKNIRIEVTTPNSNNSDKDESIIDVTNQPNENIDSTRNSTVLPYYWKNKFIFSYNDIFSATAEQRDFYATFKMAFLKNVYINLSDNTNYLHILLFDLLKEFDTGNNITKLEALINRLVLFYPEIKNYALSSFESKKLNYSVFVNRNQDSNTDYDYWKLGNKYKDKLKLNGNEVTLLNSLIDTDNKFNSIEFCAVELIRLLLDCVNKLEEYSKENNSKFENVVAEIAHIEITSKYKYKQGSYNYKSIFDNFSSTVYQCIYKTCENTLRDYFKVGRKTELNWYLHSENAIILYKEKVLSIIQPLVDLSISEKKEIDLESEIKINNYSRSRYKNELKLLSESFDTEKLSNYNNAIENLELRNQGNPFIENIYYEASKFVSKYDKSLSLTYYIKYLYHDLKSATFDNKQLTKTIQKSLFKTNEQLHDFEIIVSELIKDKDLDKALKNVSKVYEVKRRKIQLDTASIKEVQQQHSGTVELLNEYLKDDFEDENNTIKSQEISNEEIQIEITQKSEEVHQSAFVSELAFSETHTSALELFAKSNFSVSQSELEAFAKSKGIFKNQLIESINDTCYEILDDVLIEEEDDYYTINTNYFQTISAK